MKALVIGLSILATGLAYTATSGAAEPVKAETAKKVSYKEAKEECLKSDATLAGKKAELKKCIKNAEHKAM